MKNNIKNLLLLSFISVIIVGCYSDEGSYTYNDINEITISNIESNYSIMKGVDNLHIEPIINSSMEKENSKNYSYRWEIDRKVISTEPVLNYVANLPKGKYTLYFKIMDNKTGVEWKTKTSIMVAYPFMRGFCVAGEDKEGYAQLDMVAMILNGDTVVLKDMLADSGIPKFKGINGVVHTGSHNDSTWVKMWVLGDKSYYFDPITFKCNPRTMNFNNMLFTSLPVPENLSVIKVEPLSFTGGKSSGSRVVICNNGWVFRTASTTGDFYGNPINYISESGATTYFTPAPTLFYSFNLFQGGLLMYDKDNERFVKSSPSSSYFTTFADAADAVFPWNNKSVGRTLKFGENTLNKDGGSSFGNSFALMTNQKNNAFWIYKFYTYKGDGVKKDGYEIKTTIAENIDKASLFTFASNRTVMFYAVGSTLYAYDYNKKNEKLYKFTIGNGSDEITFLRFDLQSTDATFNDLFIGTYNATTGGTLRKVTLDTKDPNNVELITDPKTVWTGLCKIKNINWRNG